MKLVLAFLATAATGYLIGHQSGFADGVRAAPEFVAHQNAEVARSEAIRIADQKARNAGPNRYDLCDQMVEDVKDILAQEAAVDEALYDGWNDGRSRWGE